MENETVIEKEKEITYPLAEMFASVQGEGYFTGTPFAFIRLAGCNVGRPRTDKELEGHGVLAHNYEMCTLWDGRQFVCDTNYKRSFRHTQKEIMDWVVSTGVKHVCFTGGEPLMYDLKPLVDELRRRALSVHIETSGTIAPVWLLTQGYQSVWIAVAPKIGCSNKMLYRADEVKLLVDENFEIEKVSTIILTKQRVFLQPVNHTLAINKANVDLCINLLKRQPKWRLSVQLHKVIGVR